MSFLRSTGHVGAAGYPLCMLWHEVEIVRERQDQWLASQAVLTQSAVSALLSKEGAEAFKKAIKRLTDDD